MDILTVLKSKPHNLHYLNRYYRFILGCIENNKTLDKSIYTENHHICPRAKDLFPEYADIINLFTRNGLKLTGKQHYIAHRMLWKSYIWSGMTHAFYCMSVMEVSTLLGREKYRITSSTFSILRETAAKNNSIRNTGVATMKYASSNINFRIPCSEITSDMIGSTTGTTVAINAVTGKRESVTLEEFYTDDNLISHIADTVAVRNLDTGKITRIPTIEYINRPSNIVSQLAGNVNVRNINTGKYSIFSKEEYDNRSDNFVPFAKDKIIVKDVRTGERYQENISVFRDKNKPWYIIAASANEVSFINLLTGESGRMPKEEFDNSKSYIVGVKWAPKICIVSNKKEISLFKFNKIDWN